MSNQAADLSKRPRIKLSPSKWRKLCEYVFNRDKCCVWCGNPNNLTPAHVIRRSQGGDDSPRNVIAGCVMRQDGSKGCHPRFDEYEIELPERVGLMLEAEPLHLGERNGY